MDERDYAGRLRELWPRDDSHGCLAEALALSERAVRDCPGSASLLCMRGDLLQLAPSTYEAADDPRGCYRRAIDLDPRNAEAWESLGFYYDVFDDDFPRAIDAFRRAIECGAGPDSVRGLARALAEGGQPGEAIAVIERALADPPGDADRAAFSELEEEIERGDWAL